MRDLPPQAAALDLEAPDAADLQPVVPPVADLAPVRAAPRSWNVRAPPDDGRRLHAAPVGIVRLLT